MDKSSDLSSRHQGSKVHVPVSPSFSSSFHLLASGDDHAVLAGDQMTTASHGRTCEDGWHLSEGGSGGTRERRDAGAATKEQGGTGNRK